MRPKKSHFLKCCAPYIAEQITYLFNLIISSGVIPVVWNSAHIVPLHKNGDKSNLNNYQPISKWPGLAKVPRIVNNQLKLFLSHNDVLSPQKPEFRTKHSSTTAITSVTNCIICAMDKGKYCAALFVDLTKAFDTVDHALLLQRLRDIGFNSSSLKWFHNYLSQQQQCVSPQKYQSAFLPWTKGVPQGSILGPVMFISFHL